MKSLRAWAPFAVLLAVALGVGLAVGPDTSESRVPSATNPGPRGLAVLAGWLADTGVDVRLGEAPLTELPPEVRTVLVAAPTAAELSEDEVAALGRFVEAGGTLVALLPRGGGQRALRRWLKAQTGDVALMDEVPGVKDLGGATMTVKFPASALANARALRLSAEAMVALDDEAAVPVTDPPALWWRALGRGELWIAAGPELAENARLELLDNAAFWAALGARGPMWIDEFHHRAPPGAPPPLHFLATALQGALVALLFVAATGSRLGPPRDEPQRVHRASVEYVEAMAALTARARVEPELVAVLRSRLRRALHDALGVGVGLPWPEAARLAAERSRLEEARVLAVGATTDFLALSRLVAELERELGGRS